MPVTPQPPHKKRERLSSKERSEQLLEAAMHAYAEHGVEKAGHADISRITSASTPTVFNYFPTREALTDAVLARAANTIFEAMEIDNDGQSRKPPEVLARLLTNLTDILESKPEVIKVLLNWSVSFGPSVRPQYFAFKERILTLIHASLGEHVTGQDNERAEARLVFAAAKSYCIMKLDKSPESVIQEFVKRVYKIYE